MVRRKSRSLSRIDISERLAGRVLDDITAGDPFGRPRCGKSTRHLDRYRQQSSYELFKPVSLF